MFNTTTPALPRPLQRGRERRPKCRDTYVLISVLSEELYWNTICAPENSDLFSEVIDGLEELEEIKVIVHLRRQDVLLMSLYQQRARGGKMHGKSCQSGSHRS